MLMDNLLRDRCPWYVAGPMIGLLIVGLRATVNKPLGALGGYIDLGLMPHARELSFSACLLVGTVAGGALFGLASGRFAVAAYPAVGVLPASGYAQAAVLMLAGVCIGVGARYSGGCTSGHGISGMSLGARASVAATMTFFAVAVMLTNMLAFVRGGK